MTSATHEHTINVALGEVLSNLRRSWTTRSEQSGQVLKGGGRPDILIEEASGWPVVIEAERSNHLSAEDDAEGTSWSNRRQHRPTSGDHYCSRLPADPPFARRCGVGPDYRSRTNLNWKVLDFVKSGGPQVGRVQDLRVRRRVSRFPEAIPTAKLMPSGDCSTTYQTSIPSPGRRSYNEGRVVLTCAARGVAGQPG